MPRDIVDIRALKSLGTIPIYYETKDKRITDYLNKNIRYHKIHADLAKQVSSEEGRLEGSPSIPTHETSIKENVVSFAQGFFLGAPFVAVVVFAACFLFAVVWGAQ